MRPLFAHVIPLVRLKRDLHFFDYEIPEGMAVAPGALVEVNFRNKPIAGVVFQLANEPETKEVTIKPISKILDPEVTLAPWQLEIIKWMSEYYFTSMAAVAQMFVPDVPKRVVTVSSRLSRTTGTGDGIVDFSSNLEVTIPSSQPHNRTTAQPILIKYATEQNKFTFLKQTISSNLAANKQTLIICPLLTDVASLEESLEEFSPLLFLPSLAKVPYYNAWKKIKNNEAKVIIGTRSALFAPCHNLGTIIIDHEESEHHKQEEPNPRYNVKTVAQEIQKFTGCEINFLSLSPSLLSLHAVAQKNFGYQELDKTPPVNETVILDQRDEYKKKNFSLLSERLQESITEALEQKKKIFLFLNRKGTSGSLVCSDCGYLYMCGACNLPFTYYAHRGLICHHCGRDEKIPATCAKCRSPRLKPRGTGTEKVEDELKKLFPTARILKLDMDSPLQSTETRSLNNSFTGSLSFPHPLLESAEIIIGTVYALPIIKWNSIGLVGVISADSLLHLPDYRSAERTFTLLYRLIALNPGKPILIQTHVPDNHIFSALRNFSIKDFYTRELEDRKLLNYPPFSKLIRLIINNPDKRLGELEAKKIYEQLNKLAVGGGGWGVLPPSIAHVQQLRENFRWQILIKISDTKLPAACHALLAALADSTIIDVDPETLL